MTPQSLTHAEPKSHGSSGQTDRTRKKSLRCLPVLFALSALVWGTHTVDAAGYQAVQTLGQGGVFPVNGLAGDAYGQVVAFNRDFLFVSSPGSQPNNKSIAGGVFVYRWDGTQYQPNQVITTGGTGDIWGCCRFSPRATGSCSGPSAPHWGRSSTTRWPARTFEGQSSLGA